MKAIITKYYPRSLRKAARIVASDSDGNKVTVPYEDPASSHKDAAEILARKKSWFGVLMGAEIRPGEMAWVWVNDYSQKIVVSATNNVNPTGQAGIGWAMCR